MGKGAGCRARSPLSLTAADPSSAASKGEPGVELLPPKAALAVSEFIAGTKMMDVWRRYPNVSRAEDALTDRWACVQASWELAACLVSRGVDAVVVHADAPQDPWAMSHSWVRLPRAGVDVDLTARQFYDLEFPANPDHQDLPCPLVWSSSNTHPVAGVYDQVVERSVAES